MVQQMTTIEATAPGVIVTADEYMELFAGDFYEWVKGQVIKMHPITGTHDDLGFYLRMLLFTYFTMNPIGITRSAPFVLRMDAIDARREPDIQVILKSNPGTLTETAMIGPADICIEIVSPESVARDYGDKFQEYEQAGVPEYWIIDPIRKAHRFFRLNEEGVYIAYEPDANGFYRTPLLPKLTLHVPTLWQSPLPDILAIVESVRKMMLEE